MPFPPEIIQEVKDRTSIVAYVGESVVLKKSGHNHKGLCPFHQENSPSFMVHEEKQIFHCFGCGVGGDVIAFVMQRDGVNFPEALRHLADRSGVELPVEGDAQAALAAQEAQQRKKKMLRVNALAAEYFQQCLRESSGDRARAYLVTRGYEDADFLTEHKVGAADSRWDGLVSFLESKQVPQELALELGLIRERSGKSGCYDFFRDRAMFPICDVRGEVIAFGGRALPSDDPESESVKYLNSSDSPVFHKGKALYGFPQAAAGMRDEDRVIVVEGYLDVLALQQAGIRSSVAPLGTALTADHFRVIRRYSENIFIVFDGDEAGKRAAERSLPLSLNANLVPRVVVLPPGDDPDTIVRSEGAQGFEAHLQDAPTLFEWHIDNVVRAAGSGTAAQVQIVNALKPLFGQLRDVVQRSRYLERLARQLRLSADVVEKAMDGGSLPERRVPEPVRERREGPGAGRVPPAELACLELAIHVDGAMTALQDRIAPEDFTHPVAQQIAERCWTFFEREGRVDVGQMCSEESEKMLQSAMTKLAFRGEKYQDTEDLPRIIDELVAALIKPRWRSQLAALNDEIADAERQGADERVMELIAQKNALLRTQHFSGS